MLRLTRRIVRRGAEALCRLAKETRAQAAVEFALILPLFVLVIVSMVELSHGWRVHHGLVGAARHGARTASLANAAIDEDSVRSTIDGALRDAALDPGRATVTVEGVGDPPGSMTRVELSYPYELTFLRRVSSTIAGDGLELTAAVVMRHE